MNPVQGIFNPHRPYKCPKCGFDSLYQIGVAYFECGCGYRQYGFLNIKESNHV